MAEVRELVTVWGFDIDEKPLEQMEKSLQGIKTVVQQVGVAVAASAATLFGLAKSTAQTGDELAKTADRLGFGVEAYQRLQFAAERTGVGTDLLNTSLTAFVRRLGEAKLGSGEAVKALDQFTAQQRNAIVNAETQEEAFLATADALGKVEDFQKRVTLADKFFSEAGRKAINLINLRREGIVALGVELESLGGIISERTARDSEVFEDQFTNVLAILKGLRVAVGARLLKPFTNLFKILQKFVKENRALIETKIDAFVEGLIDVFKGFLFVAKGILAIGGSLANVFGGWGNALKLIAQTIAVILGFKFLFFLGSFTKAIWAIRTAMVAANAQVLLMPILIGAAVAAGIIAFDELLTFVQGGESFFGDFIKMLREDFPKAFEGFRKVGSIIVAVILTPLRAVVNTVQTIIDLFKLFTSDFKAADFGKNLLNRVANTFGGFGIDITDPQGLARSIGIGSDSALDSGVIAGFGDNQSLLPSASSSGVRNTKIESKVDVNVQGLTPDVAEKVARESIQDTLNKNFREANRFAEPQVER